jgi:CheY-like chemotaxis protein
MDKKKKILIVEDETLTAMMLETYIEKMGHISAGFYATGEDAVRGARTEKPDLIFMDFRLSGKMDGMEAARLINLERRTPIVIMSGYTEGIVFEQTSGFKPAAFLPKPINLVDVDGILQSIA